MRCWLLPRIFSFEGKGYRLTLTDNIKWIIIKDR